jgi:hypothetical protein
MRPTFAPSRPNARATARPIPADAPVTTTTFPSNRRPLATPPLPGTDPRQAALRATAPPLLSVGLETTTGSRNVEAPLATVCLRATPGGPAAEAEPLVMTGIPALAPWSAKCRILPS